MWLPSHQQPQPPPPYGSDPPYGSAQNGQAKGQPSPHSMQMSMGPTGPNGSMPYGPMPYGPMPHGTMPHGASGSMPYGPMPYGAMPPGHMAHGASGPMPYGPMPHGPMPFGAAPYQAGPAHYPAAASYGPQGPMVQMMPIMHMPQVYMAQPAFPYGHAMYGASPAAGAHVMGGM